MVACLLRGRSPLNSRQSENFHGYPLNGVVVTVVVPNISLVLGFSWIWRRASTTFAQVTLFIETSARPMCVGFRLPKVLTRKRARIHRSALHHFFVACLSVDDKVFSAFPKCHFPHSDEDCTVETWVEDVRTNRVSFILPHSVISFRLGT